MAPLRGRTILDCSTLLPGPFIGKLLAQKGAKVYKVENPDRPDPARSMGAFYADLNECKELVLLNLTRPEDQAKFRELVRNADGLIEGFRPAAKRKLGLDVNALHAINPGLCIASLVGYPEDGPWKDRAGHDLNFEALTGLLSLFHEMPALPLADLFGAYDGALSLACAMDSASRSGKGSRTVISLVQTLKNIQSRLVREYHSTGQMPLPGQTLFSGLYPCYRIYQAGCGKRVSVGAIEQKFWQKICEILNVTELSSEGYATGQYGQEVIEKVQRAFSSRTWSQWSPLFEAADCCVEPVLNYSEVYPHGV